MNDLQAGTKTYTFPRHAEIQERELAVENPAQSATSADGGRAVRRASRRGSPPPTDPSSTRTRASGSSKNWSGPHPVRLVLSGHIHRRGPAHGPSADHDACGGRDSECRPRMLQVLAVRSVLPQSVKGARAPLATNARQSGLAGPAVREHDQRRSEGLSVFRRTRRIEANRPDTAGLNCRTTELSATCRVRSRLAPRRRHDHQSAGNGEAHAENRGDHRLSLPRW